MEHQSHGEKEKPSTLMSGLRLGANGMEVKMAGSATRPERERSEEVIWSPPCDVGLTAAGCRVELQATKQSRQEKGESSKAIVRVRERERERERERAYKVYLRLSSSSMMAAWLPHR
jgi:hypothetical protein